MDRLAIFNGIKNFFAQENENFVRAFGDVLQDNGLLKSHTQNSQNTTHLHNYLEVFLNRLIEFYPTKLPFPVSEPFEFAPDANVYDKARVVFQNLKEEFAGFKSLMDASLINIAPDLMAALKLDCFLSDIDNQLSVRKFGRSYDSFFIDKNLDNFISTNLLDGKEATQHKYLKLHYQECHLEYPYASKYDKDILAYTTQMLDETCVELHNGATSECTGGDAGGRW